MQKTFVRNPNQSQIRRNLLNIAGIVVQGETITPQNGDRLLGGYGVAWLNNQDAASQTTGQDNPLPECNCESGGGGGGGSGGGGGVPPSGNCEKKNISELKQALDDYANQSFCDKEFPDVQFSTFIGYDKPPSDSTAKEIELRMLCPVDECFTNLATTDNIATGGNSCDGEILTTYYNYVDPCKNNPNIFIFKKEPSCDMCREMFISGLSLVIDKLNIQDSCGENSFYGYEIKFYRPHLNPTVTIKGMPDVETIYNILDSSSDKSGQIHLVYKKPNGQLVLDGCGFSCNDGGGSVFPGSFKFNTNCGTNIYQFEENCSYLKYLRKMCER